MSDPDRDGAIESNFPVNSVQARCAPQAHSAGVNTWCHASASRGPLPSSSSGFTNLVMVFKCYFHSFTGGDVSLDVEISVLLRTLDIQCSMSACVNCSFTSWIQV